MRLRRVLLDTIGSVIALLTGIYYFWFAFTSVWRTDRLLDHIAKMTALSVLVIVVAIAILTVVMRPSRTWLYPLMFSSPTLVAALYSFTLESHPAPYWETFAIFTLSVALSCSYLARDISLLFARSNNRMERAREP
jgi:hypothetical protein